MVPMRLGRDNLVAREASPLWALAHDVWPSPSTPARDIRVMSGWRVEATCAIGKATEDATTNERVIAHLRLATARLTLRQ